MAAIKLERLPDRQKVKITISIAPELNEALNQYAQAYEKSYGERESPIELIPAMLTAFLQSDREFSRMRKAMSDRT